jgi:hypothetical protein
MIHVRLHLLATVIYGSTYFVGLRTSLTFLSLYVWSVIYGDMYHRLSSICTVHMYDQVVSAFVYKEAMVFINVGSINQEKQVLLW